MHIELKCGYMVKDSSKRQRQEEQVKAPQGFELKHVLRGHTDRINHIAWHPEGILLASTSDDGTIRLWNTESGELYKCLSGNFGYSIAWSPDGQTLSSGNISSLIIWDKEAETRQWKDEESPTSTFSIAWSPDGKLLAKG